MSKNKILILGHRGLLGNAVYSYFKKKYDVEVIRDYRWNSEKYKKRIINSNADFIVNCVGAIPQKKYQNQFSKKFLSKFFQK